MISTTSSGFFGAIDTTWSVVGFGSQNLLNRMGGQVSFVENTGTSISPELIAAELQFLGIGVDTTFGLQTYQYSAQGTYYLPLYTTFTTIDYVSDNLTEYFGLTVGFDSLTIETSGANSLSYLGLLGVCLALLML